MSDIRPEPSEGADAGGFQSILSRFWGFDRLIGSALVKIVYYIGLVGIGLWVLIALFGSLRTLDYSVAAGLGGILITLVGAVFAVVFWRFTCELWLIIFQIYNRLGEIRDRLPPR
ncbi:MAG TPA: DUF4282 domain-containing protein [Allosphingosinicella sp.]|jgi:hypothetical protein